MLVHPILNPDRSRQGSLHPLAKWEALLLASFEAVSFEVQQGLGPAAVAVRKTHWGLQKQGLQKRELQAVPPENHTPLWVRTYWPWRHPAWVAGVQSLAITGHRAQAGAPGHPPEKRVVAAD